MQTDPEAQTEVMSSSHGWWVRTQALTSVGSALKESHREKQGTCPHPPHIWVPACTAWTLEQFLGPWRHLPEAGKVLSLLLNHMAL